MAQVTLSLDADALREATVQAISGVLTPEVRNELLDKAILDLLKPPSRMYGDRHSPIEAAFYSACEKVAREEAEKAVRADTALRERIAALLRDISARVIACDTDKLAERMADSLVASMRRDD